MRPLTKRKRLRAREAFPKQLGDVDYGNNDSANADPFKPASAYAVAVLANLCNSAQDFTPGMRAVLTRARCLSVAVGSRVTIVSGRLPTGAYEIAPDGMLPSQFGRESFIAWPEQLLPLCPDLPAWVIDAVNSLERVQ